MSTFLVRVEILGPTDRDALRKLNDLMNSYHFSNQVHGDDGTLTSLPFCTFDGEANLPTVQLAKLIQTRIEADLGVKAVVLAVFYNAYCIVSQGYNVAESHPQN